MRSDQENKAESLISNRPGFIVSPPIFHSLYDGPFAYCLVCSSNLLQGDTRYTIQRSFVNEEPVCEFALCVDCGDALRDEVSSQSIQNVESYFRDHVNIEDRNLNLLRRAFTNVEPWLEECLITKQPWQSCQSRTIYGDFEGKLLKLTPKPYMLSSKALYEIESLHSQMTRDRLDDFVEEFLGMPPELKENPSSPQLDLV